MSDQPANTPPAPVSDYVPAPPLEYVDTFSELSTIDVSPLTPDYQLALQLAVDVEIMRIDSGFDPNKDRAIRQADAFMEWLKANRPDGDE